MDEIERVDILLTRLNDYILSILDEVFTEYYNEIIQYVPIEYRFLITKNRVRRIVMGTKKVISRMDNDVKKKIAIEVRRVFDMVEGDYMHSVLTGKPDVKLAMLLQDMGQVHFNGI